MVKLSARAWDTFTAEARSIKEFSRGWGPSSPDVYEKSLLPETTGPGNN